MTNDTTVTFTIHQQNGFQGQLKKANCSDSVKFISKCEGIVEVNTTSGENPFSDTSLPFNVPAKGNVSYSLKSSNKDKTYTLTASPSTLNPTSAPGGGEPTNGTLEVATSVGGDLEGER
jgi:hypothetical protein